ncbi:MAG: 3-dehydroquinate synthase, partial [Alistipes sp.]|nr:3-dehydroquinate synthase [Alistipes sp.]
LRQAGFSVAPVIIPAGESSKALATLETLYDAATDFRLTRQDAIVALGGGVVGDVAGFAAATLLRGIACIQIPTTLLAQVDSSVGGKVAVNLKAGKNLAGAFHQPALVIIDPDCLKTLPDRVFADGMAEVIKYGAILSQSLFAALEARPGREAVMASIDAVIRECCDLKRQLVVEDELDTGRRMLLNFGHTLGPAYEAAYHYERYSHGEAVAAGMCLIAALGEELGLTAPKTRDRLAALLRQYGLPEAIPCSRQDYEKALNLDKKGAVDDLHLVLLTAIGDAFIHEMSRGAVLDLVDRLKADRAKPDLRRLS